MIPQSLLDELSALSYDNLLSTYQEVVATLNPKSTSTHWSFDHLSEDATKWINDQSIRDKLMLCRWVSNKMVEYDV